MVFRLWASVRISYSAGGERSSVEAWYSTTFDIEDVLSGVVEVDLSIFVADVLQSAAKSGFLWNEGS